MLFLELVLGGIGSRVASQPELLDELLSLFIGGEPFPGLALLVGDDVHHVLVEPFFVGSFQLFAQFIFTPLALFFGQRLGHRLALRGGGFGGWFVLGKGRGSQRR